MHETAIEAAAKALNKTIYGTMADTRWATSSVVRDERRREAEAAIDAYQKSLAVSPATSPPR
jgi:hypothetical protein